jgi:hypothetical protein
MDGIGMLLTLTSINQSNIKVVVVHVLRDLCNSMIKSGKHRNVNLQFLSYMYNKQ